MTAPFSDRLLEAGGRIRLPTPRRRVKHCGPRGLGRAVPEAVGVPETVDGVRELVLILVETGPQRALWNELMAREHPRGAGPLVGCQLRYLVGSAHGWLGGLGFGAAALRLRDRDRWIGWDEEQRRAHLHRVVGLSRFLIRPSVRCRNLASRVLGEVLRRLGPEFQARYGYRPWLVETFVETARHDGASLRATNWRVLGKTQGRGRQDRAHRAAETSKAIYGYELCRDWRRRLGVGPAPRRGVEPMSEGEGLEGEGWAQQELGGAPLGDRRLSRRLVESAHRQAQEPGRAFTGVARGDPAAVKGYYRLIDQPEASAVTVSNILAPHRERTRQRMQGQRTVLCIQDGSDLNFTRHGRCEGLGVIGRNQTGATARGLHLHATLVVSETGLPLGVLRAKLDAPKPGPVATRKKKKTYRWIEGLRDCAEVSRSLDGVRVVSVVDREADFFALFAEQRASPEVELLVRAKQDRVLKRKTRAKAAGKSGDPEPGAEAEAVRAPAIGAGAGPDAAEGEASECADQGQQAGGPPAAAGAGGTDGTALRDPDDSGAAREPKRHPVAETVGGARAGGRAAGAGEAPGMVPAHHPAGDRCRDGAATAEMVCAALAGGGLFPGAQDRMPGTTAPAPNRRTSETGHRHARRHCLADHADDAAGARGPGPAGAIVVLGSGNPGPGGVCRVATIPTAGRPGGGRARAGPPGGISGS